MNPAIDTLFVPDLPPVLKHRTIFEKFDHLQEGESFLLVNDHDPIPLYYELSAERPGSFGWEKLQDGPEVWKVILSKKGSAASGIEQKAEVTQEQEQPAAKEGHVLNVTLLEPKLKHPTIFRHFDALDHGESFRILNDHDPKPLYYQMIAERGNVFTWKYIQNGPQWWEVEIAKNAKGETVGELAAKDIRKASIFKKYGIDFCCGGKKSLKQACDELGIDHQVVEEELNAPEQGSEAKDQNQYHRWQPDFLADYIYNQHHVYYYDEGPVIADLLEKVVARHGADYPFLNKLKELYGELQCELKAHFMKEEKVLFPFIKALTEAKRSGDASVLQRYPDIREPMQMMEMEHEVAGDLLKRIREAAQDYSLPAGACNSFTLLYQKLEALEADLHQHIHLENNLLFPKSLELEKKVRTQATQ